jgi:hypothetical protein
MVADTQLSDAYDYYILNYERLPDLQNPMSPYLISAIVFIILGSVLVITGTNEAEKSYITPILLTKEEMEELLTQDEFLSSEPYVIGFFEKARNSIGYIRCYKFFHNYDEADIWHRKWMRENPQLPSKFWINHTLLIRDEEFENIEG